MKKSLLFGFAALLLLLVYDAGMTLNTAAQLREGQRRIAEVAGIRIELRELLAAYVNAETGQRGFLLTGEETYLEPYLAARAAIERSDLRMKTLLIPEKQLAGLRDQIEILGSQRMAVMGLTIAERREHGPEAALAMLRKGGGRVLMDDIRALAEKLDAELEATMKVLLSDAERRLVVTSSATFITNLIVASALIGLFLLTRRQFGEGEKLAVEQRASHARVETLLASERAAHSEATHANKLKDEFLAVVSHELRTPLNAILGWTTLLRDGAEDANELKEGLDTIDRNAHSQARLIDDLLDVSRIISGKVRLRISEVDLRTVALAVLEGLRPAAAARGVKLALLATNDAAEVLGDPDRLEQVMWNLVNNAIKFTPRGGNVEISIERAGSSVALEVRDTGQGIRADFLPRIFDRFSQQDASTTRGQSGLGLGLSITRHLVELHGGTITARSAGEGQGATFRVEIPMVAVREFRDQLGDRPTVQAPLPAMANAVAHNGRLDGLRILAVDDQADTLAVIHRVFTRAGADVRTALNVAAAFAMLRDWEPACIVSDIGMPGQDGYSFMRELRDMPPPLRNVPTVALTAFARDSDRALALEAGFTDHLSKPVDTVALLQKVAMLTHRV
ncbi:MAG: response regulator [Verrucomicrobia bacterium]|nr:MAG: response regulator [Verrucomicrobiota bacterium]